jgi:tripartite ATP-independent transporter DctP family solute receptor
MASKTTSYLIVGFLLGVLSATAGFAWFVRSGNATAASGEMATVLKLAHGLDQSHPVHKAMLFMADRVREHSAGTVELQVFANGQLGSETECLEQLQRGALAMTKTSTAPIEGFVPELAIFGVPYVFRDDDHFWKFIESPAGQQLLVAGIGVGLRGLCYYDAGARNFYTTRYPILKPADLKGLKIRVQQSKTAMDMVEALGGSPTPIAFGELYTALQQSMVDGAENNPPSFYTNRHFEVCKHLSMDEHARVPDMLLMSEKVWVKLPAQIQRWIEQAAQESAAYQRQLWQEESAAVLRAVEQEGVTIHYPDKAPFAAAVEPMRRSYEGTPIGELLKTISEIQ